VNAGPKLLVVEDNADSRDAVAEPLEDAGHDVWLAASGAMGARSPVSKYALPHGGRHRRC